MNKVILILTSVLILAGFNYSIYQKERIKANGEIVFLALAPVDPRSLIQGDYMALRYAVENEPALSTEASGYLVIALDEKRIGTFKRVHGSEPLAAGEKLLRYQTGSGRVNVVPHSYMFQEGKAVLYQNARYGVFKFDSSGNYILSGLADDALKIIDQ